MPRLPSAAMQMRYFLLTHDWVSRHLYLKLFTRWAATARTQAIAEQVRDLLTSDELIDGRGSAGSAAAGVAIPLPPPPGRHQKERKQQKRRQLTLHDFWMKKH